MKKSEKCKIKKWKNEKTCKIEKEQMEKNEKWKNGEHNYN